MGLISRVSSRTYRFKAMFRQVIRLTATRSLTTSPVVAGSIKDAGGKIAEDGQAREDKYFYELQKAQIEEMKSKQKQIKNALEQEKDDIEADIASLQAKLAKKKNQLKSLDD